MVFLSNLQVTAYWRTNVSLSLSSFLFHTHLSFPFNTEISQEEGDNMHCKHVFSEIRNENGFSTEVHRGFVLDSEHTIKKQLQTIWP